MYYRSGTDGLAVYLCGRHFIFAQWVLVVHSTLLHESTSWPPS